MIEAKIEFEEKKAQEADVAITRLIDKGILKSVSYGPPAIPAGARMNIIGLRKNF